LRAVEGVALGEKADHKGAMSSSRAQLGLLRAAMAGTALALCTTAWAGDPAEDQNLAHDPSVVPEQGTSTKMMIAGGAIALGWYGVGVGTSYLWQDSPGAHDLRVPVVGPFQALANTRCSDAESGCNTFILALRTLLTSLSAVGQVGGLAIMGEALLFPKPSSTGDNASTGPVRWHLPEREVHDAPGVDSLIVLPLVTEGDGIGLALSAEF
jgi:hypothetical protein